MSDVQPMVFLAGISKLSSDLEDWTLTDTGSDDPRSFRTRIEFANPFSTTPMVHVGLVGFDLSNETTARLRVYAENVSSDGVDLVVETWLDSRVYAVEVSWLAIGT